MAFADFRAMLRNVRLDTVEVDGLPGREIEEDAERGMMDLY